MTAQDTLIQWLGQSAAVRARVPAGGGKSGVATPEYSAGKTGLE